MICHIQRKMYTFRVWDQTKDYDFSNVPIVHIVNRIHFVCIWYMLKNEQIFTHSEVSVPNRDISICYPGIKHRYPHQNLTNCKFIWCVNIKRDQKSRGKINTPVKRTKYTNATMNTYRKISRFRSMRKKQQRRKNNNRKNVYGSSKSIVATVIWAIDQRVNYTSRVKSKKSTHFDECIRFQIFQKYLSTLADQVQRSFEINYRKYWTVLFTSILFGQCVPFGNWRNGQNAEANGNSIELTEDQTEMQVSDFDSW